jgi:integrase
MAGWVEKRGENKWRLNVPGGTGPDGKRKVFRKNVEARSKREAEKLLAEFVAEVQKGLYIEPVKLTFKEFAEKWLRDYAEPTLAPKTVYRYRELLNTRIIPAMGHLKLSDIKPMHILEFYRNLQEEGIRLDGKPGKLSDTTIKHHHRLLSKIFNDAVKWGLIPLNPASKVEAPKTKKKQAAYYDEEQTAALLHALEKAPLKYRVAVILTISTGLREGELMGLEWQDVDFENETIEVRQSSQYLPGKGTFTKDPKNEMSRREISVPSSVMDLLRQYKKEWMKHRLKVGDLWQGTERLFTTFNGRPMNTYTVGKWFSKFLKKNGLPPLPFHGLRHTAATLLIAEGIPLKNVSARLGHSNINTTANIYAHALKSVDKLAAEKIDSLLTGRKKQEHG